MKDKLNYTGCIAPKDASRLLRSTDRLKFRLEQKFHSLSLRCQSRLESEQMKRRQLCVELGLIEFL